MKSRICPKIISVPKLIGYCIEDEKKNALRAVAKEINIDINFIGIEYAGEKVGFAAGINSIGSVGIIPEDPPKCEALIMSGVKSSMIDKALRAMREKNIVIDLKCTVTPINRDWEIYRLIDELKREHEAMHGKNN